MTTARVAATTYVTVELAGQLFGISINRVREVFVPEQLTRVPLAPPEVAGVLNLRGRIVTAIDMRARLGLPPRDAGVVATAIGIDCRQEAFALIVDRAGDVLELVDAERETMPNSLAATWKGVCDGVHRLDGRLLLVLDVDRALRPADDALAA